MQPSAFKIDQMPDGLRLTRSAKPGSLTVAWTCACSLLFLLCSAIFGGVIARHFHDLGAEIYIMIALSAVICVVCAAAGLYAAFLTLTFVAGSEEWFAGPNLLSHTVRIGSLSHTQRFTNSALIVKSIHSWWRPSRGLSHELFANIEREWPLIWKHHPIVKSDQAEEIQDLAMLISCFTGWIIVRERLQLRLQSYEFSPAMAEREFD